MLNEDKGGLSGVEETGRLILSTATSDSSSVTVNYLIPLLLFASLWIITLIWQTEWQSISVPVLYFVFRLGLFNLDDALGMTSGLDLSGYNAPAAGYGAPAQTYNAPAPSYNAPAPSYNAPAPAPSYNSPSSSLGVPNGAGISSGVLSSGAYLSSKDDDAVRNFLNLMMRYKITLSPVSVESRVLVSDQWRAPAASADSWPAPGCGQPGPAAAGWAASPASLAQTRGGCHGHLEWASGTLDAIQGVSSVNLTWLCYFVQ